ncbi:MAG TPA: hypothetical protein VIH77_01740, partial [Steroidobacteraceae bacterium]
MSPFAPAFKAICAGLVAILLSACVGDSTAQTANPPAAKAAPAVPTVPVTPSTHFALPDFAPLVERYGPAVVNIQVVERAQNNSAESGQQGEEDPFQDFFRRFGIPAPQMGPRGGNAQPTHGEGSGFIVTPDGYIL